VWVAVVEGKALWEDEAVGLEDFVAGLDISVRVAEDDFVADAVCKVDVAVGLTEGDALLEEVIEGITIKVGDALADCDDEILPETEGVSLVLAVEEGEEETIDEAVDEPVWEDSIVELVVTEAIAEVETLDVTEWVAEIVDDKV
jgi:hypothetical protein